MTTTITIPTHWDTNGEITALRDPAKEFLLWSEYAAASDEWTGDEFTLYDFEEYIASLKP